MVALDDMGRPTWVAPLAPETPEELRRQREAQLRRDNRLVEREHIVHGRRGA
jgi:acyl-CoA hydrolase